MAKKSIIIGTVILTLLIMFGFISKLFKGDDNGTKTKNPSTIVLGMALLNDTQKVHFKKITDELKYKYELNITEQNYDEEKGVGVIGLKNSQISIAMIDLPIPGDELEFPSQIAYLWPEAKDLTPKHKAHIIISVSSPDDTKLNMFKTFTKAASSILANTNSLGIYLGSQTLVLSTDFYIEGAKSMTDDDLPLMNWIYFGLREEDGKHSGYTYGLKEFGFNEIEILNSSYPVEDIQGMLFNISHYIIQGNVTLNDGETIGLTEDQKIKIKKSKGVQLDGTTLKLEY
ncbi:MAG: hypothetical protein DI539_17500 [Flavobacterium psychrophilum]|nr:MAG: hypothetical protein DI539_17500 [Flavobacterium psychrophilum]